MNKTPGPATKLNFYKAPFQRKSAIKEESPCLIISSSPVFISLVHTGSIKMPAEHDQCQDRGVSVEARPGYEYRYLFDQRLGFNPSQHSFHVILLPLDSQTAFRVEPDFSALPSGRGRPLHEGCQVEHSRKETCQCNTRPPGLKRGLQRGPGIPPVPVVLEVRIQNCRTEGVQTA